MKQLFCFLILLWFVKLAALAQLSNVYSLTFSQNIGSQLPLEELFQNEEGTPVHLGDYFNKGKPVIMSMVYYRCPQLCSEVLNGLWRSLRMVSATAGKDFEIITVSMDPKESRKIAFEKKLNYVRQYNRPGAESGWHALTGTSDAIAHLSQALGFPFQYDPVSQQFAHPAGIILINPDGRISRYFPGVDYSPNELSVALQQSARGKLGSPVQQLLLLCFHYDPATGKYSLAVLRLLKWAAVLTMLALFGGIALALWREKQAGQRLAPELTRAES